ncbi:glycosyltransferase [Bradyrhizobium sp. HKCCYLRH3099]|uniref:glycosyltransferase n=1 Tax=unclassified Bradyrhizobium TaxID=2631580 RepID=UPI003EBC9577
MTATVLIVEPHLQGSFGHPWRYAIALTRRLERLGWSARILANAAYRGPSRIEGAEVIPTFARSYYERRDSSAARAATDRMFETSTFSPFASAVLEAIDIEAARSDALRVLVPTATVAMLAELLALPLFLAAPPRMALMFHEKPELYTSWYRPLDVGALRWRVQGSGWADRIGCFATNRRLAARLQDLLGVAVDGIGDVFDDDEIARLTGSSTTMYETPLPPQERALLDSLTAFRRDGGRLAWCPGRMRSDKGAALLPTIIGALADANPRYRLLLQRPDIGDGARPQIDAVSTHPGTLVHPDDLSDEAYGALLRLADVILLPYDPDAYGWRVSRVFLEAALAGKPVLAASGMSAEQEHSNGAALFLTDWRGWPDMAAALIARPRSGEEILAADAVRQWHRMTAWLTDTSEHTVRPRLPVLHVSSVKTASGPDSVREQRLRLLAARGFAVAELLVSQREFRRSAIREMVEQRGASSAALLGACPQPRWIRKLLRLLEPFSRIIGGPGAAPLPAVIETVRLRRGFSFVLLNEPDHARDIAAVLADVPQWIGARGPAQCDDRAIAADVEAAIARLAPTSDPSPRPMNQERLR